MAYVIKNRDGEYFTGDYEYDTPIFTDDISYAEIYTPSEYNRIKSLSQGEYWQEVTITEGNLVEEIADLKRKNQELLAKSYKQIVDEHKPAFCKLAGRDCPALNESEIRADERKKVCEKIKLHSVYCHINGEVYYKLYPNTLNKIEGETE